MNFFALEPLQKGSIRQNRLTQQQFSELCHEHVSFIPKIVTGRRNVTVEEMAVIAKAAGMTELELFARYWAIRDQMPVAGPSAIQRAGKPGRFA